jgi:hypothetical protein
VPRSRNTDLGKKYNESRKPKNMGKRTGKRRALHAATAFKALYAGEWALAYFINTMNFRNNLDKGIKTLKSMSSQSRTSKITVSKYSGRGKTGYQKQRLELYKLINSLEAAKRRYCGDEGTGPSQSSAIMTGLARIAKRDQKRAIRRYEGGKAKKPWKQKVPRKHGGFLKYLKGKSYYEIRPTQKGTTLFIGNMEKLDKATTGWHKKYRPIRPKDSWNANSRKVKNTWYSSLESSTKEGKYFGDTSKGYWRWQELGTGPSQAWLLSTINRFSDNYESLGGNTKARHIFLDKDGKVYEEQLAFAKTLKEEFKREFKGWRLDGKSLVGGR